MPFINGKRVSNAEWIARSGPAADWKQAFGYNDGSEPEPAQAEEQAPEPVKRRRTRAKKEEVGAVLSDVTGLDITLSDEGTEDDTDAE